MTISTAASSRMHRVGPASARKSQRSCSTGTPISPNARCCGRSRCRSPTASSAPCVVSRSRPPSSRISTSPRTAAPSRSGTGRRRTPRDGRAGAAGDAPRYRHHLEMAGAGGERRYHRQCRNLAIRAAAVGDAGGGAPAVHGNRRLKEDDQARVSSENCHLPQGG